MLHYDEAAVLLELAQMQRASLVAYAASCSERLFPAYVSFYERTGRGDRTALRSILDRVWQHLLGKEMSGDQIREDLARCMSLIPGENDEPWADEQAYADDAASAILYTIRALDRGLPQDAAWAARRAYEAADYHVTHRLGIEDESAVLADPVVQTELARQRIDLEELMAGQPGSAELLARLRDRAMKEAFTFFAPVATNREL